MLKYIKSIYTILIGNRLYFYDFSPKRWKSIRTTNILERAFREVHRRTRSMNNCFTNEASSDRIL